MISESTPDNRIHLLPREVVEKIAAGEVVERPSSVVKEMVENALDAGATRIDVFIEDAGFGLIKVVDNGCGMGPSDLQNAVLRHATSKITTAEELWALSTMGFRGEALASVGAVSYLSLSSSTTTDGLGFNIHCDGGIASDVRPERHNRGTTVLCRELFYNVPARRKFMKSRQAEKMAITHIMEQISAPFHEVHFTLTVDNERILDCPAAENRRSRLAQLVGTEPARGMIACEGESEGLHVEVFVAHPRDARSRPRFTCLFVNDRRVDSDQVTYAIRESYGKFLTNELRPAWFCFLSADPARIDVNMHPTKQKVKFDDEKAIWSVVYRAVQRGVAEATGVMPDLVPKPELIAPPGSAPIFTIPTPSSSTGSSFPSSALSYENRESSQTTIPFISVFDSTDSDKTLGQSVRDDVQLGGQFGELINCWQLHRMYIMAPVKDGVMVIDQHAAHERILYEAALSDLRARRSGAQRLLFPAIVNLSPDEKAVLLSSREQFNLLGFDIQDFGGPSVAVSSMPPTGFMKDSDIEDAIREMIGALVDENDPEIIAEPEKRFAASFACGAAIKFGQELRQEEMNALINALFAVQNPYTCPHGRPTFIRLSLDEMKRRFLR